MVAAKPELSKGKMIWCPTMIIFIIENLWKEIDMASKTQQCIWLTNISVSGTQY
jgi:hypothetical protein